MDVGGRFAAVDRERAWNGQSPKWFGLMLALLLGCGLASYYAHLNEDADQGDQPDGEALTSRVWRSVCHRRRAVSGLPFPASCVKASSARPQTLINPGWVPTAPLWSVAR